MSLLLQYLFSCKSTQFHLPFTLHKNEFKLGTMAHYQIILFCFAVTYFIGRREAQGSQILCFVICEMEIYLPTICICFRILYKYQTNTENIYQQNIF